MNSGGIIDIFTKLSSIQILISLHVLFLLKFFKVILQKALKHFIFLSFGMILCSLKKKKPQKVSFSVVLSR